MAANGASSFADDDDWDPYHAAASNLQPSNSASASASTPLYLGIDLATAATATTITPLITAALAAPFDYALTPLSHTADLPGHPATPTLSPLAYPSATFNTHILALVPPTLTATLCTTTTAHDTASAPLVLHTATQHLSECFDYYAHLGLSTAFIAPPAAGVDGAAGRRLGRCLLVALQAHGELSVVVQLGCDERGYEFYMRLLTACGHHRRIYLSIVLTEQLPSPALLRLVRAEQLHSITLDSGCWLTNRRGCPILAPKHRAAVLDLLSYCQAVILRLDPTLPTATAAALVSTVAYHQHYIHHLHTVHTANPPSPAAAQHPATYRDYLQSPLQPLYDNLSNQTYEVFESDPVKYAHYGTAVRLALSDLCGTVGAAGVVVWVVGAGRGPLVWAVLKAAEATGVRVQIAAFEKNKHALQTLNALYSTQWQPYQQILSLQPHNILTYTPPPHTPRPHLLVSELLGSFGDNELSPECLDAACRWLLPGGLCIPERSVSYLVPVRDARIMGQLASGGNEGREMPYVVQLHACERVGEEDGRACFVFAHPVRCVEGSEAEREAERRGVEMEEDCREERRMRLVRGSALPSDEADETAYLNNVRTAPPLATHHAMATEPTSSSAAASHSTPTLPPVSSNSRHRTLHYTATAATAITGLAGYFTATLYRTVQLSTYPPTHTAGLTSWFPLYCPLHSAVHVRVGDGVEVGVWRCVGEKRVWYEWCVDVVGSGDVGGGGGGAGGGVWLGGSMIHNAGGKAASIGL